MPSLIVWFDTEVPSRKVIALFTKTFGEWGQEEKDFYGDMIIKDIEKIGKSKIAKSMINMI